MLKLKLIPIYVYLVVAPVCVYAQNKPTPHIPSGTEIISPASSVKEKNYPELEFQRDLIDQVVNYNLIYLGIAVGIILAFGTGGYLFNIRPLKETLDRQEKILADLKKEVEENLSSSKIEIKKDLGDFEERHTVAIASMVQQKNDGLLSDLDAKIAIFEKDFTKKFDTFATDKDSNLKTVLLAETGTQVRNLEKSISDKLTAKTELIDTALSSLKNEFDEIAIVVKEFEVEKFSQKGQQGAIMRLVDILNKAIDNNRFDIPERLVAVRDYVKENNIRPTIDQNIRKAIKRLEGKEEYNTLIDDIKKEIKIFTDK